MRKYVVGYRVGSSPEHSKVVFEHVRTEKRARTIAAERKGVFGLSKYILIVP